MRTRWCHPGVGDDGGSEMSQGCHCEPDAKRRCSAVFPASESAQTASHTQSSQNKGGLIKNTLRSRWRGRKDVMQQTVKAGSVRTGLCCCVETISLISKGICLCGSGLCFCCAPLIQSTLHLVGWWRRAKPEVCRETLNKTCPATHLLLPRFQTHPFSCIIRKRRH